MDKRILAKVNMFTQVDQVLTDNQTIVDTSLSFKTMAAHLHQQLGAIETGMQPLLLKKTGYAKDKKASKRHLAEVMTMVCAGLKSYASATSNNALFKKVNYANSSIVRMRDTQLQEASTAVHDLALDNSAELVTYNVGAVLLADFGAAISRFKADNPMPRKVKITGKTERKNLFKSVNALNSFIRLQMDGVAETFQVAHPVFYGLYRNARRNYSEGIRHRQPAPVPSPATEAPKLPTHTDDALLDRAVKSISEGVQGNGVHV